MKPISLVLLLFLILSCKNETATTAIADVEIELKSISTDSLSIRALAFKDGNFWFAGNKSTYGKVSDSSLKSDMGRIIYNGNDALEFRSIAVTNGYTYLLTAGDPALIYKLSHETDSLELVYEESGEKVFYDSMQFWNETNGIAMGDPQEDCFTVLMTKNAGASWEKVTCENLPKMIEGEAAYAASNSNIALRGDHIWIATGGMAARVLHSPDRGSTWEVQSTPMTSGGEMTGIYAIDFYDEQLGVIMGGDWNDKVNQTANKAITFNGGKTWELISDGSGPGYCSDIMFVPNSKGQELIAVGSPGVWWSGNQGQDWKQLSDTGFYTIAFSGSSTGLLAGSNHISAFELLRN